MTLLLDRGADVEAKDQVGQTPLALAARCGHRDAIRLLCKRGADIKTKDAKERTVQYWTGQGRIEFLEVLHGVQMQQGPRESHVLKLPVLQTLPPLHVSED